MNHIGKGGAGLYRGNPRLIGQLGDFLAAAVFVIDRVQGDGHLHLGFLSAVMGMDFGLHQIADLKNARRFGAQQPARRAPGDIGRAGLQAEKRIARIAARPVDFRHDLRINFGLADTGPGGFDHHLAGGFADAGRIAQQGQFLIAFDQHEIGEVAGEILEHGIGQGVGQIGPETQRQQAFRLARRGRTEPDNADAAPGETFFGQHLGGFRAAAADPHIAYPGRDAARFAFENAGHARGGKRQQDGFVLDRQHHDGIQEIID